MEESTETAAMPHSGPHGYISNKDDYLKRLSALQSVALGLLDDHLNHCVVDAAAAGGPEADLKMREASAAIARLVRS
ncbi:metal-sensing transcriptional repressor [Cryobacterium sp. Sr8]|uniref:metal-sensing transcriptional repressor n=1 Tax=Cryobacterium sp. Sr8 TaxID=1259203 RepID=UPI00106A8DE3|nr:metal-sensing transcriptional repressor [Cryobacterium sp. Sr8]TFD81541.1 metal-sensing transcriptional repressor [Cryobacterium sp. Sr8]